jgi:hypothetical protein
MDNTHALNSKNEGESSRQVYQKPRLEKLGDLRTMTLGGTRGFGDSGDGTQKPPKTGPVAPPGFPFYDGTPYPPNGW